MKAKVYVISMMAQTSYDAQPKLYCLGVGHNGLTLCDYDDDFDMYYLSAFADIETAKEFWDNNKKKLFEENDGYYGKCIQKGSIFISAMIRSINKIEELGE